AIFNQQAINFFQTGIERMRTQVEVLEAKLASLNPESILSKGYSIVYDSQNNVVKHANQVRKNDSIRIKLHEGKIISIVERTEDS
ncbi:MAG: hypothetical protein NC830_06375, partial [Candidatus Omnitrophica bacterium]|nr:hypothetical protein [Candidatus Omnitrophota bacterium]